MIKNIKALHKYRMQILFLAYEQIKKQYLETAFGIGWAVVKPMVFVFSFWFFFTVGIKRGNDVDGFPYVLYLFAGYMPWFIMSDLISSGSGVIRSNSVLVKTIKFPVMSLPLINVLSKLLVHIAVMILVWIVYVIYGGKAYLPDIYYLNFLYYWFTMVCFFTGLTFILSSVNIVIKDVGPLINAIMQPLFWITPVLYTPDKSLEIYMRVLDPLYYFIHGYRDALLYEKFFYENFWYNVYIWVIIIIMYIIGTKLFSRIRPFMADLI